jgi:hypothetical protein
MKDFKRDLPTLVLALVMIEVIIVCVVSPELRAIPFTKIAVPIWIGLVIWLVFWEDIGTYINMGCDKEKQPSRCDAP